MSRIILLQFHRDPAMVRNRARLLAAFNPGVRIYGIYGGRESLFPLFASALRGLDGMTGLYCIRGKTPLWKRTHTDLAVNLWFRDVGRDVDFDAALLIQWDLLLFDSVERLYAPVPTDDVGLTGLAPLATVEAGWPWLTYASFRREWDELLVHVRERYSYVGEPFVCLGPGASLPRAFLARYAAMGIPELCHDELRLPLFAQILGFELADTGFYRQWFDPAEERLFNADEAEIELDAIEGHLSDPDGRRVFHPFRHVFPTGWLAESTAVPPQSPHGGRSGDRLEAAVSRATSVARIPYRAVKSAEARVRVATGRRPWPH